jgi:hypothetical protein
METPLMAGFFLKKIFSLTQPFAFSLRICKRTTESPRLYFYFAISHILFILANCFKN